MEKRERKDYTKEWLSRMTLSLLYTSVTDLKIVKKGGVSTNYSHCGGTLLLRFLLHEFHVPSFFLSHCLRRLFCDSWYLTSHLVIFCHSREVTFPSLTILSSCSQSRRSWHTLTDKVAVLLHRDSQLQEMKCVCVHTCVIRAWRRISPSHERYSWPGGGSRSGLGGSIWPCASAPSESAC